MMHKEYKAIRRYSEEHELQCACVNWFRLRYPSLLHLLFAVPNGSARDIITASRLKAEGVVAGVADLILLAPNKPLLIELKTKTGRQSDKQKIWQNAAERAGYRYVVIRSVAQFVDIVREHIGLISTLDK